MNTVIAGKTIQAKTIAALQKKFIAAREYESAVMGHGVRKLGSMFDVIEDGKLIGQISYNGKLWAAA